MGDDSESRIEWWPAPREGEIVPDHPPVDLTPFVKGGSFTAGPMESASEAMERYISRLAAAEAAMVGKAAEIAAQTGTCGVRVWRYEDGVTVGLAAQTVEVKVDPSVPYGHIYEMPYGQRPADPDDPG